MSIRNVVLAGISGNLGPALLAAVSSSSLFTVTVFTRPGSTPSLPSGVKAVEVNYDSVDDLTAKLQGQDAVVSVIPPTGDAQTNLINAAVAAKVSRLLPSEFGSDLDNPINRSAPSYAPKVAAQELLKSLAAEGKISYTVVYNGVFLDWGLRVGLPISPREKRAALHDGGERVYSTTTLSGVGKAVVGVLTHPEETKNRVVRVSEGATTSKELLGLAQEVVGSDGWTITEPNVEEEADKALVQIQKGIVNPGTLFPFIFRAVWGAGTGGHFKENDNELLGIQQLDKAGLKTIIQSVVG